METNTLTLHCEISKVKLTIWLMMIYLLISFCSKAQNQLFLIHEDRVVPSKLQEYVQVSKEFKTFSEQNDFPESWNVAQLNDGTFLTIVPIKNFAELDNNPYEEFSKKVGKEKIQAFMNRFDQCYNDHGSYISILNSDLSYMPDGMKTIETGKDFREWIYFDVPAKNVTLVREKLKAIKTLFQSKDSKLHYRVYQSVFGQVGDRFVVVISSKSEIDNAQMSEANQQLLGEDFSTKFYEVYNLLSQYSSQTGRMRPDLGYTKK